ncbi:MAG: insulinase family protein [Candidatus Mcinerneyibacterium aminivorans]|uniref:Insulinase family protein n=1 Tax=Candidatus Mcinerneyibacterium aminivorans TaxID=2703815 RepID=A0A5D0MKK1_9BACT|nr:MAG: insulinase family protein [Candidatus Mcinerneyibacterium aminivorans]
MQIYVIEDHDVPLAKFSVWYRVGSIDETEGITGISHMLEHSMFLGTETLEKDQIHKLVKKVGGITNAGTYYDFTMYYEEVPSAKLELAIALEADRMRNLNFTKESFQNERSVVRQERRRRIENNFFRSALEEIQAKAFKDSGLHHQIIGWGEDIDNFTREKAMNYYKEYYAPNNAVAIVAGDVDPDNVHKLVKKYFGDYKEEKVTRRKQKELQQKEERFIEIEKVTRLPVLAMLYKVPGGNHPDFPVITALMDILVNNPNSRVKDKLKREKRLIMQAGGMPLNLRIPGYCMLFAIPMSEKNMDKVKDGIDKEISKIIKNGVKDKELRRIKKSTMKEMIFMQKDKTNFTRVIAGNVIRFDNPNLYKRNLEIIKNLTSEDIQRIAKKYFSKNNRTVGYVVPKKNEKKNNK